MRRFRYFIAVMPDDDLRDTILARAEAIRSGWFIVTRPHQVHLTLRFLGEVQAEHDQAMAHALIRTCAKHQSFSLEIEGGGVFRDSIAWFGVTDPGPLGALVADLDRELDTRGFAPRRRPFVPFVTFARSQGGTVHFDVDALASTPPVGTLAVRELVVVQSRQTAFGPEYEIKSRAALG